MEFTLSRLSGLVSEVPDEFSVRDKQDIQKKIASILALSKDEARQQEVLCEADRRYEFVRVLGVGSTGQVYYRERPDGLSRDAIFRPLTELRGATILRDIYLGFFGVAPADKIKKCYDTLCLGVTEELNGVSDRWIKVGRQEYWDTESCSITNEAGGICMRQLFDSAPGDEIHIDLDEVSVLRPVIKRVVAHLEANNGRLVPEEVCGRKDTPDSFISLEMPYLAPFWVWANKDLDTFNDLLKATATNFMEHKPKGSFVLIGLTRNGKSSYIKMLHTMFGSNNTSKVELAELNNPHRNMALLTTIMNAPDEEAEGKGKELERSQAYFKSISAHEPIIVDVFYSQKPQAVRTQFMGFYPMNKFPEWTGTATQALMRRTLPIFFRNDLSKFDNNGRNFEKDTYTAQFYSGLLPVLLGIATYYKDKPIEFSKTLYKNQTLVADEVDSFSQYMKLFTKYFNGYSSMAVLFNDYKRWCDENSNTWRDRMLVNQMVKQYQKKQSSTAIATGHDGKSKIVRVTWVVDDYTSKSRINCFSIDSMIASLGGRTVREIYEQDDRSIISMFQELTESGRQPVVEQYEQSKLNFPAPTVDDVVEIIEGDITDDGELVS